jgi:hypothetical protein
VGFVSLPAIAFFWAQDLGEKKKIEDPPGLQSASLAGLLLMVIICYMSYIYYIKGGSSMKNYSCDQQLHPYMLLFILCFVFWDEKLN